jgi:hypothetical protein
MGDLINKISSYNLFNNLLPGVVFSAIVTYTTSYNLLFEDIIVSFFVYYFIGMVVSRIGSILIDPVLTGVPKDGEPKKLIKTAPYNDYIDSCKVDNDIKLLSEVNNTYRTMIAVMLLSVVAIGIDATCISHIALLILISIAVLILFIFAYKKQTEYVVKRVKKVTNQANEA